MARTYRRPPCSNCSTSVQPGPSNGCEDPFTAPPGPEPSTDVPAASWMSADLPLAPQNLQVATAQGSTFDRAIPAAHPASIGPSGARSGPDANFTPPKFTSAFARSPRTAT